MAMLVYRSVSMSSFIEVLKAVNAAATSQSIKICAFHF